MEKKVPEELKLLNEWTDRLYLKDWFIFLETKVKPENMSVKDSDGCVDFLESTKAAKIQIIDPELRDKDCLRPFNFEETLVHELLHLKFSLIMDGNDWDEDLQLRVLHQIIDEMSRALVNAKYNTNDKLENKNE